MLTPVGELLGFIRNMALDGQNVDQGALAQEWRAGNDHLKPDFSGRNQMPRLANQREDYLLKAMREYKTSARIGYAGAVTVELRDLCDADLDALAHFLAHVARAALTE